MFNNLIRGWSNLNNILSEGNTKKMLTFRAQTNYKWHVDLFNDAVDAYYKATLNSSMVNNVLEDLMLEAYRFMRFIRVSNQVKLSEAGKPSTVSSALVEVIGVLDEPHTSCVPPYKEADVLETLSFSIFKELLSKKILNHCKICKKVHKNSCTLSDKNIKDGNLVYCGRCKGYLDGLCKVHNNKTEGFGVFSRR